MSLLLLDPRAWVCSSLFISSELSDTPLTLARPHDSESTPLQLKLNDLAEEISQIGRIAGGHLFVTLLIRCFFEPGTVNLQRYVILSALSKG